VNLCHFFDFCHPKNPYEKYTPPYGTARGDPILMEGTVCHIQYLPEVWKRARGAERSLCKSRFSPRSQKIEFLTEGVEIFLEVAIIVGFFLNFFQIFISKGRASKNGCKSLETRCRSVLKSGYFAAL
jgi:hypothetical protein